MKIIMIFDQIQAGLGSKDDAMVPLTGKKEPVGPAVMMEPFLKEVDGHVVACLCCGSGTYLADPDEVSRKLCAMVNKLNPDVVICGPAFNYADYAAMSARVAIVRTPKKGGSGLNDALHNICRMAKALADGQDTAQLKQEICF